MAILFNVQNITLAYGARPLFTNISFALNSGERVGLIGPNGAGKSSLLKIIAGTVKPDSGVLSMQKGLRVGLLAQVPTFTAGKTVLETVLEGASDPDDWEAMAKAQELLAKLSLADAGGPERNVEELSGGWKKRVALARELLREPDLLLLDEPTNHLDLESILWLEDFLARSPFATLTITHDRAFLQKVSNRILDLDRRNPGGIFSVNGDYLTYVQAKEDMLNAQHRQETRLRNTLRRETEWLRRGPKARTTKQTARIDRAGDLMDAVDELAYRNQNNKVRLDFQALDKSPKKLVEAKGISKSYNGVNVLPKMDFLVSASTRVGLLGRNGSGKSTLMRILLKEEQPDTGTVTLADALQPIYFEQNRESLDPELTVLKTLCPSGDHVDFQGRQVHVKGYLDRFLFTPAQMEMAVGNLSGGEQSRLLLARLMLRKGNLLFLDEPTNDLDLETLDVLQDVLQEFKGAVLLVTHDRYFMDQVTSQIFAFTEGEKKKVVPFAGVGQWEDWMRSRGSKPKVAASSNKTESTTTKGKTKLSYKEQRELDGMESRIHEAEAKLRQLEEESHKPEVVANAGKIFEISQEMAKKQAEIDGLYARWSELGG